LFGEIRMGNGNIGIDTESIEIQGEATVPKGYGGPKAFRALRHRNYRLFFFGQLVSIIGTWMQATALPLLIIKLKPENPGVWLGIYGFLPLLPLIPLALIAGSLADRFSKRKILVLTQATMMLQAFALAVLTASGTIQMWQILLLAFVAGAAGAIDLPARQAFVIEMVGDPDDLGSGIALNSAIFNLGRAFGPVLAGLLIAALGFGAAFFVNGITFLAVIGGLLLMRLPPTPKQTRQPKMRAHLKEGLSYVWHSPTLMVLMSLVAVSSFLSMPFMTLMPLFVQPARVVHSTVIAAGALTDSAQPVVNAVCSWMTCQTPEAVAYGLLLGMFGLGALAGALLAGVYSDRGRGRVLTIGNLGFPLALIIFAFSRSFWVSMLVLFGVGILFILQNALANTLVQLESPDRLRGRVMSVYALVFQGMQGAGKMQAGVMEGVTGASFSVAIGAIASLAYGLFVFFKWPQIRRMK
jgi:MFS family permease